MMPKNCRLYEVLASDDRVWNSSPLVGCTLFLTRHSRCIIRSTRNANMDPLKVQIMSAGVKKTNECCAAFNRSCSCRSSQLQKFCLDRKDLGPKKLAQTIFWLGQKLPQCDDDPLQSFVTTLATNTGVKIRRTQNMRSDNQIILNLKCMHKFIQNPGGWIWVEALLWINWMWVGGLGPGGVGGCLSTCCRAAPRPNPPDPSSSGPPPTLQLQT